MYENIWHAVATLARVCDYASAPDGVGFNSVDTGYGHWLASMPPEKWTDKMAFRAWLMLKKYRKQLLNYDIDYAALQAPELPVQKTTARAIDVREDRFIITFPYDTETRVVIKNIYGWKWDGERKEWSVPIALDSSTGILDLVYEYGFEMSATAVTRLVNLYEDRAKMVAASSAENSDFQLSDGFGFELMPFQKAGVEYALKARRCLIADAMGLGKTVQALAFLHELQAFPAIVVCPSSLKLNWKREIEKALPGKTVSVWSTKKLKTRETCPATDIVVLNYEIVGKKQDALKALEPQAVVIDESHYVKNGKATRTKAVKELVSGIPYRLALTGTPVLNRPIELVPQLQILDRLQDLGGWKKFTDRYCTVPMPDYMRQAIRKRNVRTQKETAAEIPTVLYTGAKNLDELNEKLRATCYVRRKKEDVLTELPEKRRAAIPIELDGKTYRDLETAAALKLFEIEKLPTDSDDKSSELMKFSMQLTEIEALKQETMKLKMPFVCEWMESVLENDEKMLVFVWHREAGYILSERFGAPYLNGETPIPQRQAYVDSFQKDPNCRLLILSIKAAGVGLNLTEASHIAFIELGWTPADMDQAEDRGHRIGLKHALNVWYLLGADTVDEDIWKVLEAKRSVVGQATDGVRRDAVTAVIGAIKDRLKKYKKR